MDTLLPIVELGDPVLGKKSKSVPCIADAHIQTLIDQMIVTLKHAQGVGLAAPQVGHSWRLYLIWPNTSDPNKVPLIIINPVLKPLPSPKEKDWEGCLSIPGLRGYVARAQKIQVTYYDRHGEQQTIYPINFLARIFQHEHDHLDGLVFLDRIKSTQHIMTDAEYIKRIAS